MKHIVLSPGHNKKSKGASWRGLYEFDVTEPLVDIITKQITSMGYAVTNINDTIDHKSDGFGLGSKIKEINKLSKKYNDNVLAVELHFNSAGSYFARGCETLYHSDSTYADIFHKSFMETALDIVETDRGTKIGWYRQDPKLGRISFLKRTRCPALILEPMFMCQVYTKQEDNYCIDLPIANALIRAAAYES